jgi:hypothetical protein
VETLALIVVFIAVLLVLTRVFGMAEAESARSGVKTGAVRLAENTAEMVSAARDREGLLALLDEANNARAGQSGVTARYGASLLPDASGNYEVSVTWEAGQDGLVNSRITVRYGGTDEPVYTLETAVYVGEVGR